MMTSSDLSRAARNILFLALLANLLFAPAVRVGATPPLQTLVPLPMHAPWSASHEWENTPGSKYHKDKDKYAIDFNVPGAGDGDAGSLVLAVSDGVVVQVQTPTCPSKDYGCEVVVGHAFGYETRYAHLESVLVAKGQYVTQGTPLGQLGNTGNSAGAHLHFSVYHCDLDPSDPKYPRASEPCPTVNLSAVSPQLWDGQAQQLLDANSAAKFTSGNYGVGYEAIGDIKDVKVLVKHQDFIDTYKMFGGEGWVFGLTRTPVQDWAGTKIQEFYKQTVTGQPWSDLTAALIEHGDKAFFVLGPIWDEYKRAKGPEGKWGVPVSHTYEWILPGGLAYRSDFAHGSIVWLGGSRFDYLDEQNALWVGHFFDRPNTFSGDSVTTRDTYLNFNWTASDAPGPVVAYDGFSVTWETTEPALIRATKIVAPAVQGHLRVSIGGKVVLTVDSPDKVQPAESPLKLGLGDAHVEVRFWQERGKPARLWLTTAGVVPVAFSAGEDILVGQPPVLVVKTADYAPPPFPGTSLPVTPVSPQPPQKQASTATMLLVDVSSSMSEPWHGGIKIDSAKSAAHKIVAMLQQESQAAGVSHRAGVASFSVQAYLNEALSSDYGQLEAAIDALTPLERTNIGGGLDVANNALGQATAGEARIIILLSDGMTNEGPPPDEILAGPVQQAAAAGTCIYTVGFGDPGGLDEDLLRRIAAGSGCGEYYYASDLSDLEKVYIRIRHVSTGQLLGEFSGDIAQNQTAEAGKFDVPVGQGELAVSLHWPGSALDMLLTDPKGKPVDQKSYPQASIATYSNMVYAIIPDPLAGTWRMSVYGRDVPEGSTRFDAVASSRAATRPVTPPPPAPGGLAVVLLAILVGGGSVAIYVLSRSMRRTAVAAQTRRVVQSPGTAPRAELVGVTGEWARCALVLSANFSLGRSASNSLRLSETAVSRRHAIIRYAGGRWFLQDQSSALGTFVNGQRVTAVVLNNGDRIRIGVTELEFRLRR